MMHPPRVVSSRVSWLITIVLSLTGALAHAKTCDVDADGDIDRNDYIAILADIGQRPSGQNDPRDADGNGRILSNDAQLCARRCTLPLCDIPAKPANKAPIAKNDAATTALNTRVRINVIANDRDRDGRIVPRTVRIVTNPKQGKVTRHRNGTVTYRPALGFRGRDSFRYRVKDNDGAPSNAARVRITVKSGNRLPMADAGPDFNVATGALVTLDGSNSSDPDGDPLTFSWQFLSVPPASTVSDASLANPATAAASFTTDADGPYELALEVSDGQMTDVDTVTVTAATPNVPPNADAGPDQSALIGQIVNLDGQASSDSDAGPAALGFRWFFVAVPPGSTLTDANITGAATALASFAPDVAGAFRVGLEVDDGADTDPDEVVVTVSPANVAPNASAGTDIVVQLGNQATLDGTASNDPDNGPSPLSFQWTFVSVPPTSAITGADLSGATTATPSFTPDLAGFYLLRLDVSDADLTDMDQIQVKANVAPAAVNDGFTVVENTTLTEPAPGILVNDTDGNSDPLTAALVTDVGNGTLALNADGSFTYTPDTDFEGTDSFTYLANDGSADSNVATVTLTITHANEAPVAVNDTYTTDEDIPLVVPALGVLGNDTDVESDPLTAVVDTAPSNGALTLNSDGSFTYTPNADFNGTDSFTYHANDGLSDSNAATVSITVDAVNDVPSFTVGPDQTVLENAGAQTVDPWTTGISSGPADEAGQTVSFNVTGNTNPALFSAGPSVSATGVLTYTPAAAASGSATITLTLADDGGTANGGVDTSALQSFTITVDDINAPPSFTAGPNQTVNEGAGPQTVNPWATAIDDGDPGITQALTFNVTGNTNAALFSAGPAISAAGVLTYTLAADANGTATITLTLSDDGGTANGGDDTSGPQSFTITVAAVNDAPAFTAGPNQAVDEDSGAQSVSGWASGISPGPADESGQTVNFNITGNTNPSLFSSGPSVSPSGVLTYTPAANAFGIATITLTLSDDGGTANGGVDTSAAQSFTITVNGVNDAPSFASGGNVTVLEDAGLVTVNPWATGISAGPANESGQTLAFNITGNTAPGLFAAGPTVSSSGVLIFTPAPNAFGSATITLVLQDNGGTANGGVNTSASQSFTINVTPVNDSPVATAKSHQTHSGIRVTIGAGDTGRLKDGATDVDDPFSDLAVSATFTSITPAGATVTLIDPATGTFSYNPPAGFSGPASFQFQVCDDGAPTPPVTCSALTTVSFTVTGPDLWFVDDSAGAGGTGRLTDPFDALSDLPLGRGTSDRIFVFTGTYGTGHTLFTNEHLIGEGSSGSFDSVLGVTVPGNGTLDTRPALGGTRPQLNGTVTLAGSSTVRGLNIASAGATGLSGGAVAGVSVSEASVTSTTGTAVNLNGTGGTVGLTAVSANGGTNGILLNNTTGSFTVTGTGTAGSGGTIQNGTIGVSLTNSRNVSLTRMQLNGFSDFAIRGSSVVNFTMDNTVINGVNGNNAVADEGSVRFTELTGSATVSNCNISGGFEDNFKLVNTTGTLNRITFTNTTIGANSTTDGNDGIGLESTGSGTVLNVTVQNSFFTSSRGDLFQLNVIGNSTSDLIVTGNTLSNNHPGIGTGGGGVTISGGDNTGAGANLTSSITSNTFRDAVGHAILFVKSTDPGTFNATFDNNQIGVAATANSGSLEGSGLKIQTAGLGTVTVAVTNNQIRQYNNFGIEFLTGGGASALSGALNATVTGNTIANPGNNPATAAIAKNGIHLNAGTVPLDTYQICLDAGGSGALPNSLSTSGAPSDVPAGGEDIRLRQRQDTTVRLRGYTGTASDNTAVQNYLIARNGGDGVPSAIASNNVSTATDGFFNTLSAGAACPLP